MSRLMESTLVHIKNYKGSFFNDISESTKNKEYHIVKLGINGPEGSVSKHDSLDDAKKSHDSVSNTPHSHGIWEVSKKSVSGTKNWKTTHNIHYKNGKNWDNHNQHNPGGLDDDELGHHDEYHPKHGVNIGGSIMSKHKND